MRFFNILFLFCFVFGFSQKYSKDEKAVLLQVKKLDSLMMKNDVQIIDLFCSDVHSDIPMAGFKIWMILRTIFHQKKSVIKKSYNLKFQN